MIVCREEDVVPLTSAIARNHPTYSRRSTGKKSKQLQVEFLIFNDSSQTLADTGLVAQVPHFLHLRHIGNRFTNEWIIIFRKLVSEAYKFYYLWPWF